MWEPIIPLTVLFLIGNAIREHIEMSAITDAVNEVSAKLDDLASKIDSNGAGSNAEDVAAVKSLGTKVDQIAAKVNGEQSEGVKSETF